MNDLWCFLEIGFEGFNLRGNVKMWVIFYILAFRYSTQLKIFKKFDAIYLYWGFKLIKNDWYIIRGFGNCFDNIIWRLFNLGL